MSVEAYTYVIKYSSHKGGDLLCLMIIATHAAPDGTNSFPSVRTLAEECRMSERQVRRIIDNLEGSGELRVHRGRGRGNSHVFTVVMQPLPENRTLCPIFEADSGIKTGQDDLFSQRKTGQNVHNNGIKPDILSRKTGHFEQENRTFTTIKPDIYDTPNDNRTEPYITVNEPLWDARDHTHANARAGAPATNGKPKKENLSEGEWLAELRAAPAHQGIDVDRELSKCHVWCENNNREFTRRRFVNWLNRTDKPIRGSTLPSATGPPRLTPTEQRIAADQEANAAFVDRLREKVLTEEDNGPPTTRRASSPERLRAITQRTRQIPGAENGRPGP